MDGCRWKPTPEKLQSKVNFGSQIEPAPHATARMCKKFQQPQILFPLPALIRVSFGSPITRFMQMQPTKLESRKFNPPPRIAHPFIADLIHDCTQPKAGFGLIPMPGFTDFCINRLFFWLFFAPCPGPLVFPPFFEPTALSKLLENKMVSCSIGLIGCVRPLAECYSLGVNILCGIICAIYGIWLAYLPTALGIFGEKIIKIIYLAGNFDN